MMIDIVNDIMDDEQLAQMKRVVLRNPMRPFASYPVEEIECIGSRMCHFPESLHPNTRKLIAPKLHAKMLTDVDLDTLRCNHIRYEHQRITNVMSDLFIVKWRHFDSVPTITNLKVTDYITVEDLPEGTSIDDVVRRFNEWTSHMTNVEFKKVKASVYIDSSPSSDEWKALIPDYYPDPSRIHYDITIPNMRRQADDQDLEELFD